jgi:hypothetical protein
MRKLAFCVAALWVGIVFLTIGVIALVDSVYGGGRSLVVDMDLYKNSSINAINSIEQGRTEEAREELMRVLRVTGNDCGWSTEAYQYRNSGEATRVFSCRERQAR